MLLVVFFGGALSGCLYVPGRTLPPTGPVYGPVDSDRELADLATLVNQHRQSVGCPALRWDARVEAVAQRHSEDLAARGVFSHEGARGESPFDRLRAAGIAFRAAAENIAYGQPTARAALSSWLGSPGHRANLENCTLTHHGAGVAAAFWTHVFVTPQ